MESNFMLGGIDEFRPDLVTNHSIETALSLVRLYDLHLSPKQPVDIGRLLESFELRFEEDLPDTTWGFTLDLNHNRCAWGLPALLRVLAGRGNALLTPVREVFLLPLA